MRLRKAPLPVSAGQAADQVGQQGEADAAPGADGLDAERDGEMRLTGAGLADEMDRLVPVGKAQAGEPGHLQGGLDPAPLAHGGLLGEQWTLCLPFMGLNLSNRQIALELGLAA
jgi:hypothetical protein